MATIELAFVKKPKQRSRDAFLAPNGTYYAVRFPDVETAKELVALGVNRIVLPGIHFDVLVRQDVADILFEGNIDVVYQRFDDNHLTGL